MKAKDDEKVVFSWFEYPDKATRDAANEKMMSDPRMEAMGNDMPFDGKRMIMGGFDAIVEEGARRGGYTDGFVVPVPERQEGRLSRDGREDGQGVPRDGAMRVVEAWGDDVPDGKVTDFYRAVKAEDGETVVFSFVEWPDKATRDAAWEKIMADETCKPEARCRSTASACSGAASSRSSTAPRRACRCLSGSFIWYELMTPDPAAPRRSTTRSSAGTSSRDARPASSIIA